MRSAASIGREAGAEPGAAARPSVAPLGPTSNTNKTSARSFPNATSAARSLGLGIRASSSAATFASSASSPATASDTASRAASPARSRATAASLRNANNPTAESATAAPPIAIGSHGAMLGRGVVTRARLSAERRRYTKYAAANPTCASIIIRYMWVHDGWFSLVASASGSRRMSHTV